MAITGERSKKKMAVAFIPKFSLFIKSGCDDNKY
jgi:hypothetical protein